MSKYKAEKVENPNRQIKKPIDENPKTSWVDKIFCPVSSEFDDKEELERKRRLRRQKINQGIKKVTTVAKEGLGIYYQMREKNPVSIGLGALSAYGIVSEHILGSTVVEPIAMLRDMGYYSVCQHIGPFVRNTYKYMAVPMQIYWRSTGDDATNVEEYTIGKTRVFFIDHVTQEYVEGPFVKDERQFYDATSVAIEQKYGRYIVLDTNKDDSSWSRNLCLESVTPFRDAYVSPFDEGKLIENIKKFFDKGYNRALLFYGPPGSGKTTLALRLTEALGGKILILNGWALASKSTGSIFNAISVVDPSIILFDDLDRIRDMEGLLSDLERLNHETSNRKRLYIATVNNMSRVPKALRRPGRFDQAIEFKAHLNKEMCCRILKAHAEKENLELPNSDLDRLASLAEGMTGAYLKEIVLRVSVLGMDEIDEHILGMRQVASADDDEEKELYDE